MKKYVRVYLDHFGYCESDVIMCEVCKKERASEIHHVLSRSRRPDLLNDIINLMAICRGCHVSFGDNNLYLDLLQNIHNEKLNEANGRR